MTAYFGVQNTIINNGNEPAVTAVGGRVRAFIETFTYAAQAAGSTIQVANLPAGAQILGFELVTSVSTSTTTVSVGDGTTSAAYSALAAYTTANLTQLVGPILTGAGVVTPLAAPGKIVLTTAVGALPASGTLLFTTYYTVD